MTEKRYSFEMDKNCYKCIVDIIDKKLYTDKKQILDLLNELNDKNELFRQSREEYRKLSLHFERRNNELISDKAFLEKENEQLKKENELLKQDLEHCANQFKEDGKNVLLGLR